VIEGVMMRSPRFFAVACRRANKEIVVQEESVESLLKNFQWLNKPFLRGTLALIDSMTLGMKSLMFSANIAMADAMPVDPKPSVEENAGDKPAPKKQSINDIAVGATMVIGLLIGVAVFMIGPYFLGIANQFYRSLAEGLIRIAIFVGYIAAISQMNDIKRVFEYHGAEHKVINTYEANLDLTDENFSKFTTIHPRCGTSFILVVLVLSIVLFSFLGFTHASRPMLALYRLLFLPIIAGIGYEAIRFAGKHKDSRVMTTLLAPGLLMQKMTTREPTDDQVEVALSALQAVMKKEAEA
jgi:uncharacterized protein YqhQ